MPTWLFTTLLAAAIIDPPLPPEKAMKATHGESVIVEFKVVAVTPYTRGTLALDPAVELDDRKERFAAVLSEKALEQLKKIGVPDAAAHFRGKKVRVKGPVTADVFTGLNMTGTRFRLAVDDIAQFEAVE